MDLMIEFLKDSRKSKLFNETLRLADIALDNIDIQDVGISKDFIHDLLNEPDEEGVNNKKLQKILDILRVVSLYKKQNGDFKYVPSLLSDSLGTNKFAGLIINIHKAMFNNEILIIDELDNSLHHSLTKELLFLMNSTANKKSQFILTSHDIKLLDSNLLRKDQVYLIDRKGYDVEIYSINHFKANSENDTRSSSNYQNLYESGRLGALPYIDFYDIIKGFNEYDERVIIKE